MEYDRTESQVNTLDVICSKMGLIRGFWCGREYVVDPRTGEVSLLRTLFGRRTNERAIRKNGRWSNA
jgi:hypothetical protein